MDSTTDELKPSDACVLVAVLIAAHRTGDRLLMSVARRELENRHGIRLTFIRPKKETSNG